MVDKPQSPISKTARLLDLVPFLLSHQNIPLAELSIEFGVTQKEMIEDLNTLWMCGLPGYTPLELIDLSFDSGIVSISNADVLKDVRSLSFEEIMALLLGLDILKASLPQGRSHVEQTIEKLKATAEAIVGKIVMLSPSSTTPLMFQVREAISRRVQIAFSYLSASEEIASSREVIPLDFFTKDGVDYIDGFCLSAQGFRTFRCDRISDFRMGKKPRQGIPPIRDSEVHLGKIRIHGNPRDVAERFALKLDDMSGAIGATREVTYFNHQWVERMAVASLGDVEIIEPSDLRSRVARRADALLQAYKSNA